MLLNWYQNSLKIIKTNGDVLYMRGHCSVPSSCLDHMLFGLLFEELRFLQRRDRSAVTMITLYRSPLWNPTKIGDIQLIENVQKQFTRKDKGMSDFDYWERLEKLKLLSLQRRRERYSIIHVWKMLNDKATNNIGLKT